MTEQEQKDFERAREWLKEHEIDITDRVQRFKDQDPQSLAASYAEVRAEERDQLTRRVAELEAGLREADQALSFAAEIVAHLRPLMPHADDVAGATRQHWQAIANNVIFADEHSPLLSAAVATVGDPTALLAYGERCVRAGIAECYDSAHDCDPAAVARRVLDEGGTP